MGKTGHSIANQVTIGHSIAKQGTIGHYRATRRVRRVRYPTTATKFVGNSR